MLAPASDLRLPTSDFKFRVANVSEGMKEKTLFYQQELPF